MQEYYEVLKSAPMFDNIDATDTEQILGCLGAERKFFHKDDILLLAGDKPRYIGVVIEGELYVNKEDRDGNRHIIAAVTPGQVFAEALCCADISESPVTVTSETDSLVLLLDFSRLLRTCPNSCVFHSRLIQNMLELVAKKNLLLQERMEIISLKSIRSKVMRYLEAFVPAQGYEITIPFNREQLADHLCVERSALSHELARMKKDGLIDYHKNKFVLLTFRENHR